MNFNDLIGKIFGERELYDLLVFELEENFDQHATACVQIFFDRHPDGTIQITEVADYPNWRKMSEAKRQMTDKREWYDLYLCANHYIVTYVRLDRSGWVGAVYRDKTCIQDSYLNWLDEIPDSKPLTQEEFRLAFQDLMGVMQDGTDLRKLKSKRSV